MILFWKYQYLFIYAKLIIAQYIWLILYFYLKVDIWVNFKRAIVFEVFCFVIWISAWF